MKVTVLEVLAGVPMNAYTDESVGFAAAQQNGAARERGGIKEAWRN